VIFALGFTAGPGVAQNSAAPEPQYKLSPLEKEAVAEEEAISPNDGPTSHKAIPGGEGTAPNQNVPATEPSEVFENPKKTYPVTTSDLDECIKTWDPQTQMSKAEWKESCQRTLRYYPENP
jgi:hypothetical protein